MHQQARDTHMPTHMFVLPSAICKNKENERNQLKRQQQGHFICLFKHKWTFVLTMTVFLFFLFILSILFYSSNTKVYFCALFSNHTTSTRALQPPTAENAKDFLQTRTFFLVFCFLFLILKTKKKRKEEEWHPLEKCISQLNGNWHTGR